MYINYLYIMFINILKRPGLNHTTLLKVVTFEERSGKEN